MKAYQILAMIGLGILTGAANCSRKPASVVVKPAPPTPAEPAVSTKGKEKTEKTEKVRPMLVNFHQTDELEEVLKRAKSQKKLVFIDFYTSWCLPCKVMEQGAFVDEDLAKFMNDNFLNVRVNAEKGKGPSHKANFFIFSYPTLIFVDGEGNEFMRWEGSCSIEDLKKMGRGALWKYKNQKS